jgi:hypothetical protein
MSHHTVAASSPRPSDPRPNLTYAQKGRLIMHWLACTPKKSYNSHLL